MAALLVDMAAVASPGEILMRFQCATGLKVSTELQHESVSAADVLDGILELQRLDWNIDISMPHRKFNIINNEVRTQAWKVFLNTEADSSLESYHTLCQKESKPFSGKIHDDAFRTFKGDADFWSKVSVEVMERVLNALSHDYGYVQGMNVLLGPFLYVMNEEDSFHCVRTLLHRRIPRYVLKNLDGAHDGAKLFAKCLRLLDPKLYTHLISKIPDLSIFSLRYVLTLFANAKPLTEVLLLWDAILAVGVHFNLLLLCAKLMLLREPLLKEKRGSKLLQILEDAPVLSAPLIDGAFALLRFIPPPLQQELTAHAVTKIAIAPGLTPPPSTTSSTEKLLPTHASTSDDAGKEGTSTAEEALASVSLSCSSGSSKSGNISVATSQSVEPYSLAPAAKLA